MKNKSLIITLIAILSLMAFIITGGFIFLLAKGDNFHFNFNFGNPNLSLVDSMSENKENINKIYLNLKGTDVEIKTNKEDEVKIEYYSNRDNNAKVEKDEDILKVDENNYDVSCIGFCNSRRKVVVYIPEGFEKEFDINTKSGDVYSDIDLLNNQISIKTQSGDVSFKENGNIDIETQSGDVSLISGEKIKVKTQSGDVSISKITNQTDLETSSGDISIKELDIKENSFITSSSGDVTINNNAANCYIESSTKSGDNRINHMDRMSEIVLKINTSSGDINVN